MNEKITLDQARQIRIVQKTKQKEMATNLIQQIKNLGIVTIDELETYALLDALGLQGLSLTIGEDASRAYIELCGAQQ